MFFAVSITISLVRHIVQYVVEEHGKPGVGHHGLNSGVTAVCLTRKVSHITSAVLHPQARTNLSTLAHCALAGVGL